MSENPSSKSSKVQTDNADIRANNATGGALVISNDKAQSSGDLVKVTGTAGQSALNVTAGNVAITDNATVSGELKFRKTVTVGAFTENRLNIGLTASGSIVTFPANTAASNIGLPKISSDVKGWHVTLVAAADIDGTHAITIRQGGASDGSGTLANTPFFGILMDDGANSLAGTASAVMVADKVKKGDHIEITCDGTNYIIRAQTVTAGGVTVGS